MSKMQIELSPWVVPNFTHAKMPPGKRQDGFKEAPTWKLSELDADVLSALCDDFRAEVFRKAGKPDPAKEPR